MSAQEIFTCDTRFISKRSSINQDFCDFVLKTEDAYKHKRVVLTKKLLNVREALNVMNYREALYRTLFPNNVERMLNFTQTGVNYVHDYMPEMPQWNVKPRKRPLITHSISALDMPNIAMNLYYDPIDWSSRGIFATVFENEIYTTDTYLSRSVNTNTMKAVEYCVKWNASGTRFACGMRGGKVVVWDYETLKTISQNNCVSSNCTITRIEWDSRDRLITGCSCGHVLYWSSDLKVCHHYLHLNEGPIIYLKLSHSEEYLVISTLDGSVNVTEWPFKSKMTYKCSVIVSESPMKAIAWHPSKNWLAVGGEGKMALLRIININLGEMMYSENLGEVYNKDALAWNPVSNELVVSAWKKDTQTSKINGAVFVLSSLSKIVDNIDTNSCRVPYLLWGHSGNLLATVGVDETLKVWKFFGNDTKTLPRNVTMRANEYDFSHISSSIR